MNKDEIINLIKTQNIENANVLGIFYNKVCIGEFNNNEIIFNEEVNYSLCNQIRVFHFLLHLRLFILIILNQFETNSTSLESSIIT